MKFNALEAALNATWAMEERALEAVFAIAGRDIDASPEALAAYQAKTLERSQRATVRGNVAVLDAIGVLTKRGNLFTAISGATSYEILRADLQTALDDPKVKSIVLNIDSPGGEASGTGELAQAIFEARGTKPIVAYVGGNGASAAYWIASAADRIVVDPGAILGSIGVQAAFKEDAPKPGEKTYTFVSSQSPDKNPELGTDKADKQIQTTIDAMAQVFVSAVARNRGVAIETVLKDFGKGGTFVGQMAIDAGLADSIGTFEGVIAEMTASGSRRKVRKGVKTTMEDETITAADRDAAVATATAATLASERSRVSGLRNLSALGATEADITAAIDAGTTIADFSADLATKARAKVAADALAAEATATAEAAAATAELTALETDEAKAAKAAASNGEETDTVEAVANRIANA